MHPVIFFMLVIAGFIVGLASVMSLLIFATIKIAQGYMYVMVRRVAKARKVFSDYEQQSGHRKLKHKSKDECSKYDACSICDLFICEVCGAVEGALLPTCPGRRLTEDENDKNYADFMAGEGPWTPAQS